MLRTAFYRLCLTLINIVFPPVTVLILTGPGMDTLVNCFLFLLAVIPSHVHGFYLSWIYFSRRHKAKRGRYPGKPHSMIYSDKINNGGLSNAEVDDLWLAENGLEKRPSRTRQSRKRTSVHDSKRISHSNSRSSSIQSKPPLPPPSPVRPHRSSSQHSDGYFPPGAVARNSSIRSNNATAMAPTARPWRSSSVGSTTSHQGSRRQNHAIAYRPQGSAPLRRHPAATVRV